MADVASGAAGWFPVLTAALGYIGSWVSERLRDRRTAAREREARESVRRAQLSERRAGFQRETLINLQDAVVKLTRAAGRMHHSDEMEFQRTGTWGGHLLPEDISDDAHQANVAMLVLTSRVRDQQIRELADSFRSEANKIGMPHRSREADRETLTKIGEFLEPLHKRIGEILRRIDDDEDAATGLRPRE